MDSPFGASNRFFETLREKGFSLRSKSSFLQYALQRKEFAPCVAKKLFKINDVKKAEASRLSQV